MTLLPKFARPLALLPLALPLHPQESWTHWRGPTGNGVAPEAQPPVHWGSEKNLAWVTPLPGHGKSTPIVHGGRIFLQAAVPGELASAELLDERERRSNMRTEAPDRLMAFLVLAIDAKNGEVLWETLVTERLPVMGVHRTNGYASFSPVTDGESVYVSFGSYGVYALDVEGGEVRWSYELGPQFTRRGWGEGGSPTLVEDTLVVVADQEEGSFIVALDTEDGSEHWMRDRDEPSTWTTPLYVEAAGARQLVVNGTTAVRSYELETGDVLWHVGGQTVNAIPSPVSDGHSVMVTSGYRGSLAITLPLSARGDVRARESISWTSSGGTPYVPSPVLFDGRVYFTSGNSAKLSCLDFKTGERLIDRRRLDLGQIYASPLVADGRLYVTDREGTTLVMSLDDDLEVLASNVIDDPVDATPVAVGDTLYLRSDSKLYAIREAREPALR